VFSTQNTLRAASESGGPTEASGTATHRRRHAESSDNCFPWHYEAAG